MIVRLGFLKDFAANHGIEVFSPVSHTLFNPADVIEKVFDCKHVKLLAHRILNFRVCFPGQSLYAYSCTDYSLSSTSVLCLVL